MKVEKLDKYRWALINDQGNCIAWGSKSSMDRKLKKRTVVKFGEFEIGLAEDHLDFKQEKQGVKRSGKPIRKCNSNFCDGKFHYFTVNGIEHKEPCPYQKKEAKTT